MALLDDIIGDKGLSDDTKFQIGDRELTLGELRGVHSQLGERDTRLHALEQERDGYRGRYDELASTMTRLLGQADRMTQQDEARPAPPSPQDVLRDALSPLLLQDPAEPLFHDKVFGSFANRLRSQITEQYDGQLKKLSDTVTAMQDMLNNGMQAMTAAQVQQEYRRWYGENKGAMPKDDKGKTASLEQMTQYAARNGMFQVDGNGRPTSMLDLDRALDTLTQPTRREAELKAAAEEGYQRGLREQRTNAGKVIPFMSERSAGGLPKEQIDTTGKSQRQLVREAMQRGLNELSQEMAESGLTG